MPAGVGTHGRGGGVNITGVTSSLTTFEQYEDAQDWVVTGTGIMPGIVAMIDGVPFTTTYNSSTQFTVAVPQALTSGSPLRTATTKVITTTQGGTWSRPVASWSGGYNGVAATLLPSRRACFIATPSDCNGATHGATFTPWTDRTGRANGVGQWSNPIYYTDQFFGVHGAVYMGADNYMEVSGDPLHSGVGADWYAFIAMRLGEGFTGSLNYVNRYLTNVSGMLDIRRNANDNRLCVEIFDGSLSNTTFTPALTDYDRGVLTIRHQGSTGGGMSVRWSTAAGIGTPATNAGLGSLVASLTRFGANAHFAQDSNARFAQIIMGNANLSASREKQYVREALLLTAMVT